MSHIDVAVFIGSLRNGSHSEQIAKAISKIAPAPLALSLVEIGQLPLYNPDLDGQDTPKVWTDFRNRVRSADAFLFVTPEYNRSIPAVLKNALDVGSRPYGENAWRGKPGAVVSHSIGSLGGFGANHHLRQCLTFLDVPVFQQPEAYVANSANVADDDGNFQREETGLFFSTFTERFARWIASNSV